MSLEQALAANTAAIEAQTAALTALTNAWNALRDQATALKAGGSSPATVAAANVPMADAPKVETAAPKADKAQKAEKAPAPSQPATEKAEPQSATGGPATESPSDAAAEEVTLEQVTEAITKYAKAHREVVVGTLAKYGAKRGSELAPENRALFLREVLAAVGAV